MRLGILGLDGATWSLLDRFFDEGLMPGLRTIREQGASGDLTSVWPPLSPVAWPSAMTGCNPGRHGVFEFLDPGHNPLGGHVNTSASVQAPFLWELAGQQGLRTVAGGVPMSYPLREAPGFYLGDFLSPPNVPDFASDAEIFAALERHLGEPYRPWCTAVHDGGRELEAARALTDYLDHHLKAVSWLTSELDWDLFIYDLMAVDRVQHELWHVWDESHPKHAGLRNRREAVDAARTFWSRLDEGVCQILDQSGDDVSWILMSDHGFGPITHYLNFNVWLLEEGFLQLQPSWYVRQKAWCFRRGITPEWIYGIMGRLGLANQRVSRFQGKQDNPVDRIGEQVFLSRRHIDWSRTRAYAQGNFGQIFVNLQGRQPQGCVPRSDYQSTLQEVEQKLLGLEHSETGEPLVDRVLRREEIYDGPMIDRAPDLMAIPRDWRLRTIGLHDFTTHRVLGPAFGPTGDHRLNGIFVGHGPAFASRRSAQGASLLDLAPTALHLLGVPAPPHLDGRVLTETLSEQWRAATIRRDQSDGWRSSEKPHWGSSSARDFTEDEAVKHRLAELGYL